MLELTTNWRAQNDPELNEFIKYDLRLVKNGEIINYKTYNKMSAESHYAGLTKQEN